MSANDAMTVRAGRHTVRVNRPDKVLFAGVVLPWWSLAWFWGFVGLGLLWGVLVWAVPLGCYRVFFGGGGLLVLGGGFSFAAWFSRGRFPEEAGGVPLVVGVDSGPVFFAGGRVCLALYRCLSLLAGPDGADGLVLDVEGAVAVFAPVRAAVVLVHAVLVVLGLACVVVFPGSGGVALVVGVGGVGGVDGVVVFALVVAVVVAAGHPAGLPAGFVAVALGDGV
ncbi:bifunctional non-homologous end joining protein LigD [Actinacidiphila yanglinensis]|uniref:Bifunctional non-homologous end joining protein LigD n=1 Tax=Actinacidiphila yanglinensis TaxID=310779 RepID=A0A1H6DQH2_9ACTN|nr:hypothetical protein [Actinacidiphila yanglinensis]SEG87627.1 bifunctional non-homologous end joining protein LigD [Actinacidiphila yanglinensis]